MQAKKYYGQNFISNHQLIERIISLLEPERNANSLVIEIGPGKGALTTSLAQKFKKVLALEIDSDLVNYLQQNNKSHNVEIIEADVLTVDWPKLLQKHREPNQKVFLISNLPYYITSPILFKVFQSSEFFELAVFMMQKEVAQRVSATKDTKNYNNLSVASQFFATVSLAFEVPRTYFHPTPKVDSAVVKMDFIKPQRFAQENNQVFIDFVRQIFNNRRKTILNNLSRLINDKKLASNYLEFTKIHPSLRPENLSLDDFIGLFKAVKMKDKL